MSVVINTILDTIDNCTTGITAIFGGLVITTKSKVKSVDEHYQTHRDKLKLFYAIFIILYLLYVFFVLQKRVIESNIYVKILTAIFNICAIIYSSHIINK